MTYSNQIDPQQVRPRAAVVVHDRELEVVAPLERLIIVICKNVETFSSNCDRNDLIDVISSRRLNASSSTKDNIICKLLCCFISVLKCKSAIVCKLCVIYIYIYIYVPKKQKQISTLKSTSTIC